MLTSVVITYHNEGPLLERAVRSIDTQAGRANIEIVVVDDASDIPPPPMASRWPLRVIRSERSLHVSGARNLGIRHAQGDLVAFLDADDEYAANRIAPHVAFFEEHPEALMVGGQTYLTRDGEAVLRTPPVIERYYPKIAERGGMLPDAVRWHVCNVELCKQGLIVLFGTGAMTIRRHVLEEIGGFDEQLFLAEDWDIQVRIAQHGPIGFVAMPAYYYHAGRQGSITTIKNPAQYLCGARAYRSWRRTVVGLPKPYVVALRAREHEAALLAAQLWLERRGDPVNAMKAVIRSFRAGVSMWAVRSLVRSMLWRGLLVTRSAVRASGGATFTF